MKKGPRLKIFLSLMVSAVAVLGTTWAKSSRKDPGFVVDSPPPIIKHGEERPARGAPAQQPETITTVDPHVLAGGGGTSTGGSIRVDGTNGEPSAGNLSSGGSITVIGGFWNALQETGNSAATSSIEFAQTNASVAEGVTFITVNISRTGDTRGAASADYATANISATERSDFTTARGTLRFAPGETAKTITLLISDDSFVEGPETFTVNLSNISGAGIGIPASMTIQIDDNPNEPQANVNDDPATYVGQHYHDFLNRQADTSGLGFWINEITSCGSDQQCISIKRINVSAAFYLSIEFQQTGYLVERLYKTAYGDASGVSTLGGVHDLAVPIIRLNEFLPDTQKIGLGVIVGQGNWEQVLENNKQSFTAEFAQRSRFTTALPTSLTPAQFVDQLNTNAGSPLSEAERNQLVNDLASSAKTRAQVLRAIAEHPNLVNGEFNRAFVLMQYFGYLRRNPNDPPDSDYTGYDFWLTKLSQFNGNFVNAEMVKAFITSLEYRQRFGT
jgi:hypothetical protein